MHESTPKQLSERTGKHLCVHCLAPIPLDEYLRNDHICNVCAAKDEYPLASTPDEKPAKKKG